MDADTTKPNIEHVPREDAAKKLLYRFYPVHYVVGMTLCEPTTYSIVTKWLFFGLSARRVRTVYQCAART
jgi:hypothetical protein